MSILPFIVSWCMIVSLSGSKGEEILDWQSYKTLYQKVYTNSVSESLHKQNFIRNVKKIETHNVMYEDGNVSYSLGLNEFSDQDPKTFCAIMNGYKQSNETITDEVVSTGPTVAPLAENFDWRAQSKVSPVKNQGSCGSCWAFSTLGALESKMLIAGKSSTSLSEQQLVDCDKSNKGCGGGSFNSAFQYIQKNGIVSTANYPYTGKTRGGCKFSGSKVVTRVTGSQRVPNDAGQVMSKLKSVGPLSAAMDASNLQQYSKGVYECSNARLDHAVLIVGYGTDNGKDYWIVKNSWGTRWGDKGYVKISRKPGRDCGITKDVAYATI